jgi:hypothetical protein
MKDNLQSPVHEEAPQSLTIYKPEEELFQRLCLCQYLSELPEITEAVTENSNSKKKE